MDSHEGIRIMDVILLFYQVFESQSQEILWTHPAATVSNRVPQGTALL